MSFKPLQALLMLSIKQIRACYAYCYEYMNTFGQDAEQEFISQLVLSLLF